MKKILPSKYYLVLCFLFSFLSICAQSTEPEMTVVFNKPVGSILSLTIKAVSAKEQVVFEGLERLADGNPRSNKYILKNQTVRIKGRIKDFTAMRRGITAIDVTQMPTLQVLYVGYNSIKKIDLTHNPLLDDLNIGSNELTEIDLSHNPLLSFIDVSDNQLQQLDCSSQTQGLWYLYCHSNNIQADAMNKLIESLPDALYPQESFFVCVDTTDPFEKNTVYKQHVEKAKAKGYLVNDYQGGSVNQGDGAPYEGADAVNKAVTFTTSGEIGAEIYAYIKANGPISLGGMAETGAEKQIDDRTFKVYQLTDKVAWIDGEINELYLSQSGITSLTLYSNTLTTLDCSKNELRQLNISHCPQLKNLNCSSNQIITVNTSENTALEILNVEGNIYLTSLDVANNPMLQKLYCGYSMLLKQLDLSKNINLEYLLCESSRELNSIIVNPNGKLNRVFMPLCDMEIKEYTDVFFNSLPVASNGGKLYFLDTTAKEEKNKATEENIKIARDKGWEVYSVSIKDNIVQPYGGVTGIDVAQTNSADISVDKNVLSISGGVSNEKVFVIDSNGRVVCRYRTNNQGELNADLSALAKGIYIVTMGKCMMKFMK